MKTSGKLYASIPLLLLAAMFLTGAISPEWKLVSRVAGKVESQTVNTSEWIYIHEARLLKDGDKARTLDDSRAKIQLADQSVITLGSNTTVELARFQLKENARIVELKMAAGRIRASVAKFLKGESSFEVKTTKAVLAARGTEFFVDVANPEVANEALQLGSDALIAQATGPQVFLQVMSGSVQATIGTTTHIFHAGQSGIITPQGNVIINPVQLPSLFTGSPGWGRDADLRQSSGTGSGGPGAAGPPPSHVPQEIPQGTQGPPAPTGINPPGTPGATGGPTGPPPPPVFLNPTTTYPVTEGSTGSPINPGTGTINVNIK